MEEKNEEKVEEKVEEQIEEQPVEEEEGTPKKGKGPLIVVLSVIVLALLCSIGFVLMNPKEKQSNREEEKQEKEKKEEAKQETEEPKEQELEEEKQETVEQETEKKEEEKQENKPAQNNETNNNANPKQDDFFEIIKKLEEEKKNRRTKYDEILDYVPTPVARSYYWKDYGFLNRKATAADFDINHIVYNAREKLKAGDQSTCPEVELDGPDGGCQYTYKVADVKKSFEKMYGTTVSLPDEVSNVDWSCKRVDDLYVCLKHVGDILNGPVHYYFGMGYDLNIKEQYKLVEDDDSDYIYLHIKYARVVVSVTKNDDDSSIDWKPEDVTLKLYKYGTGSELITIVNGKDLYEEKPTKLLEDKLYEKYGNMFTEYKITYKKNGNDYTFVSVEPVQ